MANYPIKPIEGLSYIVGFYVGAGIDAMFEIKGGFSIFIMFASAIIIGIATKSFFK